MSTKLDLLLTRSGITYRQLDHWTRKGWIEPRYRYRSRDGEVTAERKSGYVRDFTEQEERVIIRMGRLTNIGLKAEQAAVAARSMVDRDEDWVQLDGGVIVQISGLAAIESWNYPTEVHMETVQADDPIEGPPLDWEKQTDAPAPCPCPHQPGVPLLGVAYPEDEEEGTSHGSSDD